MLQLNNERAMFEKLRAYLERAFPFSDEEFELIQTLFIPKHFRKGEFFLREGEVAKYGAFVVRGCLRSYSVDNKGKEHILMFAPEEWWTGNLESARTGTPSAYFIDALEDTDVLLQDAPSFNKAMSIPAYARGFQEGIQRHAGAKDRRIIASLSASAEERYTDFLNRYPSIAQRVPQHMLASYLGITPETLSRIRKSMSQKK